MEELETSLFQTRKAHRIEQMVARWLRRSRDSSARAKVATADGPPGIPTQTIIPVKHTVKIDKDTLLQDYGFHISESLPLTVVSVTAGGSAHGKLFPGDQILQMNDEPAEDLSCERAVNILREAEDSLSITVVRCTSGVPKSSFLTEEKRARLKTNPVKVHFAEEVLVSGHSQGNSLLCMPNVLKLYLENGQTKAFKFEAHTTVKDIILTVKEKLSIRSTDYFALVLEEQYNVSRLHLLHEEELIQQVVEREESHDYRCLFRVCFVPRDPLDLLKEDPVAFEYLYLQSCSDVLQERFAVEMKCSSALRLAALHIQERIYACAQPQKISLKYIEKDWGIENFISPTLLRNMKGKDIKKAISFHMKRNQNLLEPRQKQLISAAQLRLNYLQILGELKTYGGKIFNATLMLQDRESYIALLVGAKYGISQIINSKLNIMSTLAEFANISRVELTEESEKVSMVKVYLQDVKVLTLLLESNSAKDLACLIAGYYRLFVDPVTSIFLWPGNKQQVHRVSAEEGYESRACSDSEESSEVDCVPEPLSDRCLPKLGPCRPLTEEEQPPGDSSTPAEAGKGPSTCGASSTTDSAESEASDSANTESRGCRTSGSSESMDALEEDDLDACSSSRSGFFHLGLPGFPKSLDSDSQEERSRVETSGFLCLLDLAQRANTRSQKTEFSEGPAPEAFSWGPELNALRLDPRLYEGSRIDYYSLCASVSPASHLSDSSDSTATRQGGGMAALGQRGGSEAPSSSVLQALTPGLPLALEDGSSDEEYYDAADKFTPPDALSGLRVASAVETSATGSQNEASPCSPEVSLNPGPDGREPSRRGGVKKYAKTLRKRRSFLQTDHTCQVSFPLVPSASLESVDDVCYYDREPYLALGAPSPTVSSLQDVQGEPGVLETKALGLLTPLRETKSKNPASRAMEMEPETMETKSVIDSRVSSISAIRLRIDPNHKENSGIVPLTSSVASSPANTPRGLNPGSSGPDTTQAGPPQTFSPFQDLNGSAPRELTLELGNSTSSLSSANVNPDRVCLTVSPGPHTIAQGDTLELGGVQVETGLGSVFINPMPETAPQDTEPLLSSRDGPKSDDCGINPEEMMASFPAKEEQQGQLSLEHGREVTNKNDTSLFHDESGKDPGDPKVDGLAVLPQTTGASAPAGGMVASLFLETPVTGTEQTPLSSPTDPQGQSREIPGQDCQAQEQKLLVELDFSSDFLLRDQTISSAFSLEEGKAEPRAIPGKRRKVNAGGEERGRDAASSRGAPPSAHPKAVAVVAEGTAPGRWLPMEASELLGPGLVERLEQLATCPLCGGPFEDPVLLACEHSFCRACLARRWGTPPATGPETPPTACPCCGLPCPRRSLRSNVRLAVEVRISRGLREKLAEPGARAGKRRGGRIPTMGCLDPQGEDMKMTWRRFDAPTPKASNSKDELPEDYPVVKNMLHRLTADLTLDPGTAHRRLLVSEDRRSVRLAPPGAPAPPDGPARFDQLPAVLGAQGFGAGRHCWEVETADTASLGDSSGDDEDDGESLYALGAAGESVRRKGRVGLCPAGAVWAVEGRGGRLWALTAPEPTPLGGARPPPRRIRVDLDWERGRVAFYDGRSLDLLFAFQAPGPLGERVFPLLCTRDARAQLRIVPAEG